MFGRLFKLSHEQAHRRADELLERFDLAQAADRPARTYSGGMRRRLDIASRSGAVPMPIQAQRQLPDPALTDFFPDTGHPHRGHRRPPGTPDQSPDQAEPSSSRPPPALAGWFVSTR
jgi:hypothetical protein